MRRSVVTLLFLLIFIWEGEAKAQGDNQAGIKQIKQTLAEIASPEDKLIYLNAKSSLVEGLSGLEQGEFLHLLAGVQEELQQLDAAITSYTQAIARLEQLPLNPLLAHSYLERSYINYLNSNDAKLYCQDRQIGLRYARQLQDPELTVKALSLTAFCFNSAETFDVGIKLLDEALEIAKLNQLSNNRQAMIYNATAALYRDQGLHRHALAFFKHAYELWLEIDDTQDMFNMLHNIIGETINLFQWDQADIYLKEMEKLTAAKPEFKDFSFFYHYNVGRKSLFSLNFTKAILHLEQAIALQSTTNEAFFVHTSFAFLSIAYIQSGDQERAVKWANAFNQSVSISSSKQDLVMSMQALGLLGQDKPIESVNILLKTINYEREKFAHLLNNAVIFSALDHNAKVAEHENRLLEKQLEIKQLELQAQQDEQKITRLSLWLFVLLVAILLGFLGFLYQSRRFFKHRSQTDFLTGVASRSFTMEEGAKALETCHKLKQPLALVMLDIDHFKHINDSFGHDIGDMAIRAVAQRAKHWLKRNDILGRIGGEEFLLVLPNNDRQEALVIAERLRVSINEKVFKFKGIELKFSISLGVALSKPQLGFKEQVKNADLALYQAKNAGRNCVSMA
jgi:diguanylate cyclase (GGDEF)-like protein